MKRVSPARKMIAFLGILAIFAGTQGFVISSHTCNSCGTHEETISLFGAPAEYNHECPDGISGSCCQAPAPPEETPGSCCKTEPAACDKIETEPCCEFDSERVTVETLTVQKTLNTELQLQPAVAETINLLPDTGHRLPATVSSSPCKHGSGRDITRLTCCLLI